DMAAARPQDRAAILFDLGLGLEAVDACVRVAEPAAIACLRARIGRPILAAGSTLGPALVALRPHRVFVARFGRIEVYTPIPPAGGLGRSGARRFAARGAGRSRARSAISHRTGGAIRDPGRTGPAPGYARVSAVQGMPIILWVCSDSRQRASRRQ